MGHVINGTNNLCFLITNLYICNRKSGFMEDIQDKTYEELKRLQERYKSEYGEMETQCAKEGLPFDKFKERSKEIKERLYFIDKYLRKKTDPIVEYGKTWKGKIYEMDEFSDMVSSGLIHDNDGYGYYATIDTKSDIEIKPSDILENIIRADFTHVIWFKNE